jgi:hypothetical protein
MSVEVIELLMVEVSDGQRLGRVVAEDSKADAMTHANLPLQIHLQLVFESVLCKGSQAMKGSHCNSQTKRKTIAKYIRAWEAESRRLQEAQTMYETREAKGSFAVNPSRPSIA